MERKQKSEQENCTAQVNSNSVESPVAPLSLKARKRKPRGKNRKLKLCQVYDWDNLRAADKEARKGKAHKYGVTKFDRQHDLNMDALHYELEHEIYHTTKPHIEPLLTERKERMLSKVYYRDHVAHHALMRVISPYMSKSYYYESAASIIGRGIHYSVRHVRRYIDLHKHRPLYWVQLDFTKFYHHIKRAKIYAKYQHCYHDKGIQRLCHDFIYAMGNHNGLEPSDGSEGLGIGLFPVQPAVNFYLNDLDRKVAAVKDVKLFRYCDNLLLIGFSPAALWQAIKLVQAEANDNLEQPLHTNIGVQKLTNEHGIDYIGYKFFLDYTYIRKDIKQRFLHSFNHPKDEKSRQATVASYKGWLMHCNALHLWQTITGMKSFADLGLKKTDTLRNGERYFDVGMVPAASLVDRKMIVKDFIPDIKTNQGEGRMCILVEENGKEVKFLTNNPKLKDIMLQVKEMDELPFEATLKCRELAGHKKDYYFE